MKNRIRNFNRVVVSSLTLLVCLASASAQTSAPKSADPKAQYLLDTKSAQARYESDKLLCNDETTTPTRLQCRREAKAEFDKAMSEADVKAKAQAQALVQAQRAAASAPKPPVATALLACADCSQVVSVSMTEKEGEGSPLGLIAGGAAGALLGRQIGSGTGKDLATIAGALGGAFAGKKIEEKVKTHKVWTVGVRYPDGSNKNFDFDKDPGLKVGDTVKNADQSVVRY
jgi:outer membrane lipoprotein SlyB